MTQSEQLSAWNEAHERLARAEERVLALRLHPSSAYSHALLGEIEQLRGRVHELFDGLSDVLGTPCAHKDRPA